jgi:hypothetical protein
MARRNGEVQAYKGIPTDGSFYFPRLPYAVAIVEFVLKHGGGTVTEFNRFPFIMLIYIFFSIIKKPVRIQMNLPIYYHLFYTDIQI